MQFEVTSFSVAICMNKTKILGGQLNCSVKLADVSTRCSSHPQGKRASSRNVGKFYRTVKLSTKNLHFIQYAVLYTHVHVPKVLYKWSIRLIQCACYPYPQHAALYTLIINCCYMHVHVHVQGYYNIPVPTDLTGLLIILDGP